MANKEHHRLPRRLTYVIVGAAGAIPVAILAPISGATASTSSTSPNGGGPGSATITANQGTPGTTPWPVTGTVNVGNFPSSTNVSGTVAATQRGPWTVTVTSPSPYSDSCSDASNGACQASATTAPVVIKNASILLNLPTGTPVQYCAVSFGNGSHFVYIPMTKQGTTGAEDLYAGNSQLDMAVPAGSAPYAYCPGGGVMGIGASFDGEGSSS